HLPERDERVGRQPWIPQEARQCRALRQDDFSGYEVALSQRHRAKKIDRGADTLAIVGVAGDGETLLKESAGGLGITLEVTDPRDARESAHQAPTVGRIPRQHAGLLEQREGRGRTLLDDEQGAD